MRSGKINFSCPHCNAVILSFDSTQCQRCHNFKSLYRCNRISCKFQETLCTTCDLDPFRPQYNSINSNEKSQTINNEGVPKKDSSSNSRLTGIYFSAVLVLFFALIFCYWYKFRAESFEEVNVNLIKKLKEHYRSQKEETWFNFMGVLDKKIPTVKTIIFLHGEDRRTADCLTNELVYLYTKNETIKNEDITFSNFGFEVKDYGIVLEHYRPVIKRFKIFITDLNKVSGNIARIFHSLCDEVSSDIKPSLFIFTLKYDKRTKNLKPMERVNAILKEAWNDLPENEIFPLLSRVVKIVVDVIPQE